MRHFGFYVVWVYNNLNYMNQSKNFSGKPIISQILSLIPRDLVYRTAVRHQSDRYVKIFKTYDHLITLLYSVLSDCTSLRELSTAMLACEGKLNHLGIDYFPKRSTLSDANNRRSHEVFADIYYALLKNYQALLSDSCPQNRIVDKLFVVDSSTVLLFSNVFKGVGRNPLNGKKKGGMKIHTLMQASQDVPRLVNLTAAAQHDHTFLSQLKLPAHSWLVFDKGYTDYKYYVQLMAKNIFFVTRQKENAVYESIEEFDIADDAPDQLLKDEHIHIVKDDLKLCLRRIAWMDMERNKCFEFITNNFEVPASTIAAVYKQRWQIELLFKRLKQNFSLKYFLGDSANAIMIQVWVCLIAHLILKIIQLQVKRKWAFSNLTALIRYHLMSYIRLFDFLTNPLASFENLTSNSSNNRSYSLLKQQGEVLFL